MNRLSSVLFVFWVFLVGPGLCGIGLLSHACLSDESNDCSHEELCAQDPCSKLTIRSSPAELLSVFHEPVPASPVAVSAARLLLISPRGQAALQSEFRSLDNISVLPGDLPLRI